MAEKLWGGRFSKKTHPLVEGFTASLRYDYKLAEYDLLGSMAHVHILKKAGFLTVREASALTRGLGSIYASVKNGAFAPDPASEDIHTAIQNLLQKRVGNIALKLHTARSRNDQVVFATKFYCKMAIAKLCVDIERLEEAISHVARRHAHIIIPGFTHLQHAQPVYVKDYLGAYIEMLKRDEERMRHIFENLKITMGAGALAGTPIEARKYNIKASEFLKDMGAAAASFNITVTTNSLDVVSDRDYVIEVLSALAVIGMHMSRLSEDLIIWSTQEFDFVELDDSFCTGSSLMPQKKNPDALELVRGYAGRLSGNLVSVLTMMKGLPLTYNRDMQLDKEPLFGSFEIVSGELKVLEALMRTLKFNESKIRKALEDESLYATDLVYYLVSKGVPFKDAHTIVGKLITYSINYSIEIKSMSESLLKKFCTKFVKAEIVKLFDPEYSVRSKKSIQRKAQN